MRVNVCRNQSCKTSPSFYAPFLSVSLSLTLIDDLFEIRYLSVVGCLSLKATSTSSWFHLSVSTTSINWFTFNTPQHPHTFNETQNFLCQYQQQNFLISKKPEEKKWRRRRRKFEEGENPCKVLSCISLSIKMKMTTRWEKRMRKSICARIRIHITCYQPTHSILPIFFYHRIHLNTTYPPPRL